MMNRMLPSSLFLERERETGRAGWREEDLLLPHNATSVRFTDLFVLVFSPHVEKCQHRESPLSWLPSQGAEPFPPVRADSSMTHCDPWLDFLS